MTTSSTEKELLALLRQRDVDLEERGKLLLKTKVAIEQLQQELSASRKEEEVFKEEARKAYEDQLGQARAIQAQLQLCEEELEARTHDLTRYAAENRNLQVRGAELEAELDSVREEANSRISQLEESTKEQTRTGQQQQSELQTRRKEVADLQAKLQNRSGALADHSERAKQLQQERDDSEQLVRELMRKLKKLQEKQTTADQSLKASTAEVQQAQLKLQQAQAAAEAGACAAQTAERDWQSRMQQQEQQWAAKHKELEKRWAAKLVEAGRQARAQRATTEEAQQQLLHSLQGQHAVQLRDLHAQKQQNDWQTTNEKALLQKHWESKVTAAVKAEQDKSGQAEKQWQGRLQEVQQQWQAKLSQGQLQWAQEKAAAEQAWREAKQQAEQLWKQQLESISHAHRQEVASGEAMAARGRAAVEAKLAALTDRLLHMARKEAKREKRRVELVRAVEELRLGAGSEHTRRRELEGALRESATIFKRELHDKNLELAALQQQLGSLRTWQGQALESMSQDLSRSMQSSPELLQTGHFRSTALRQQPHGRVHQQHLASPSTQPRHLASLATPLATPHWLQRGALQTPPNMQARPAGTATRVPKTCAWGPAGTLPIPADSDAVPRANTLDQSQQARVEATTAANLGILDPASGEGAAGDPLDAPRQSQGEEEEQALLLPGSTAEEEVLESELQALRAARQQLQRASLSQEQLRKSLVMRIADKLEDGSRHVRLPSALSSARSRAQLEDTIPAERSNQEFDSWQAMQQPEKAQQPASAAVDEDEQEDADQLQSWNAELTQRLNAAMSKAQPLSRPPRRARARQHRQHTDAAVT